jgi:DMSO/TMAO reductase YedYZ heme-binding membrane subunit
VSPLLASGPSAYWYTTRGAGIVALLLLTASLVMGVVDVSRWHSKRWPRFLTDGIHRTVSLLALAVVAIHVVTTVLDGFTQIGIRDAIVPFASSYRPIWVGFGALAFDLLLALTLTSVLRRRLGYRAWRAVHWASYACWPLALIHGLGSGTDSSLGWMLAISAACLVAVLAAVGWRIGTAWPKGDRRRALALSAIATALLAMVIWVAGGPLGSNWAARAGTPATLLAGFNPAPATGGGGERAAASSLPLPFSANLAGTVSQSQPTSSGQVVVDIQAALHGGATGALEIQIKGQGVAGGGVSMTSSTVTLGPPGQPRLYQGRLRSLQGTRLLASVSTGTDQARLDVRVAIDPTTHRLSGTLAAQPAGTGAGG